MAKKKAPKANAYGMEAYAEEQERIAEELHKEMYTGTNDDGANPPLEPSEDTPPVDDPEDTPPEPTEPKPEPPVDDFKHKYEVLQGKYNTEVARMGMELSEVLEREAALQGELDKYKKTTKPDEPLTRDDTFDGDEDVQLVKEDYPSLYSAFTKIAKKTAADVVGEVVKKVDTVETHVVAMNRNDYWQALDTAMADWREINHNPEFSLWLKEKEKYTGVPKEVLLGNAFNTFDVAKTLEFFKDFKATKGPAPAPAASEEEEEEDIAPPTSKGGVPPPASRQTNLIKRSEIAEFYKKRQRGAFSDEDAAKIEAKFIRAIQEGRVVN
jgi:hypothetical protein